MKSKLGCGPSIKSGWGPKGGCRPCGSDLFLRVFMVDCEGGCCNVSKVEMVVGGRLLVVKDKGGCGLPLKSEYGLRVSMWDGEALSGPSVKVEG